MVKKGHPSPGFEPAPLEGSKKVMKFWLKLYHWATGAFTYNSTGYFLKDQKNQKSITNNCSLYLMCPEIVWKNGKYYFFLNSLAQSEKWC